jgi:hypothetical protein
MTKRTTRPDYSKWPRRKVKITELFLDPDNIRLQVDVSSQEALINDLFVNEDAMQVLESIATNGFFPDETPVVIRGKSKFVVIDGNRRVAALKVLARPDIVPSKASTVKELIKNTGSAIKDIEVVMAPSRDSVRHFLASKHTQNTRRPWRPLRQAYFYKAELGRGKTVQDLRNDYPHANIAKFLRLINVHKIAKSIKFDSPRVNKRVHDERSFPASTIERMYEDRQVRQFLGFDFDKDGEVRIQIERKEFEKGFKKIVQDIVEKVVDSRSLNNEDNRKKYIASFPSSDVPKRTKSSKTSTSKDFKEIPPPKPEKRKKLAPSDIVFSLKAPGVKRMLVELQGIDYHKFPNACHDLLRSFLECGLKAYFDHIGKTLKPPKGAGFVFLDHALQAFKDEMDAAKNTELSQVAQRIKSNAKMSSYSAQFMNATNHNPSVFATDKDAEDAWDAMDKLFRFILNPK